MFRCAFFLSAIGLLALSSGAMAQAAPHFLSRVCNVRNYGAEGSIVWLDTAAFQKAIDDCASSGGGTVEVPRGNYLTAPLFLRSNINLHLAARAAIVADTDPKHFEVTEATKQYADTANFVGFINITGIKNVAITGEGLIDGQGAVWWERTREARRNDTEAARNGDIRQARGGARGDARPRLIVITNSQNVAINGVHIENSPSFNILLKNADNVAVTHITLSAPAHSPNTDAVDPTNSRHVLIADNVMSCGDDVVAIKSTHADPLHPDAVTSDIIVRNNKFLEGRGISIGSDTSGGVKHVLIENNSISGAMYGIRIKSRRGFGGEVSDVTFRNNHLVDVETPFVFSSYYQQRPTDLDEAKRQLKGNGFLLNDQTYPDESDPAQTFVKDKTPDIHDVVVDGLTATNADRVGIIIGLAERDIRGFAMKNIHVAADTGLIVRNAAVKGQNIILTVKNGPKIIRETNGHLDAPGLK